MNRNGKNKRFFLSFVCGAIITASVAACSPATESEDSLPAPSTATTESVAPSSSEEVVSSETDVELTAESTVEPTAEPTAEPVENTLNAETAVSCVNELMERYSRMPGIEQIPIAFFAANYDYLTEEDRENYMSTYGLSEENLSSDLNDFYDNLSMCYMNTLRYNDGSIDKIEIPYATVIKLEDLMINENDIEYARIFDNEIKAFINDNKTTIDKTINLINQAYDGGLEYLSSGQRFCFNAAYNFSVQENYDNIFDALAKGNVK